MPAHASTLIALTVGCFAFYGTTGCNDRAAPAPAQENSAEKIATRNAPTPRTTHLERGTTAGGQSPRDKSGKWLAETWYAITIDSKKVGYRSIRRRAIQHEGAVVIETAGHEHLRLVREGRETIADFNCIAREDERGAFLQAKYRLPFGLTAGWTEATVEGQTLRIRPQSGAGPTAGVPWPPGASGPFAVEESLRSQPLAEGQTRTVETLDVTLGQVITTSLHANQWESTQLLGSKMRLLRIEARTMLPNAAELHSTLWVDGDGAIWKDSQKVGVTVVAYRTSMETALADDGQALDVIHETLVPIDTPLESPHDRPTTTYKITLSEGDPSTLFASDSRQHRQVLGPHQIQLEVRARSPVGAETGPGSPQRHPVRTLPVEADRVQSSLVECDDPSLKELALSVAASETNASEIAIALEALVCERVEDKSYGKVFASATEVAMSREGDCTEHTVLLVALCRAREIPARAAMGLVYSDAHQAFAYHMWTEAWTGSSWIGLDATLGRGRLGPTHLKMSQSSLEGPSALAEMATILQAVGGLEIEVVAE